MIGSDIRNMDEDTKEILMNKEVIAINQDPQCAQPYEYGANAWVKNLENGDFAVMFVNVTDKKRNLALNIADAGIDLSTNKKVIAKNLWTGEEFEVKNGVIFDRDVEEHATKLYRCRVIDG
jgi:alpha-galactosidase